MKKEELDELLPKLKEYIITVLSYNNIKEQPIEEIVEIFKIDLLHRQSSLQQKIEEQKDLPINQGTEKIRKYRAALQEIKLIRQMFEVNPKSIIEQCLKEIDRRKEEETKLQNESQKINNLILSNLEKMNQPTQELLEKIKREAKAKYPIPDIDDEQSL